MTTAPAKKTRPLSPHLGIYKPQISSVMSILHRATGIALGLGLLVLVAWLVFMAGGADSYAIFTNNLGNMLGKIALLALCLVILFGVLCCAVGQVRISSPIVKSVACSLIFIIALALTVAAEHFVLDRFPETFDKACDWAGTAVLFGLTGSFFYHLCCGIRHLLWDAGKFLSIRGMNVTGWITIIVSAVMTGGLWIKIWGIVTW